MFRWFENLVDPYVDYVENDTPSPKLWPFFCQYMKPFRTVFFVATVTSIIVAFVEIFMISYIGRIVDVLSSSDPSRFWPDHGTEVMLVALFILILRPLFQIIDVGLLNNGILPNFGTMIRWRAHRHVLRQSVEWFENDFAGRIANRIMQTPPAAGEAVFQVFDAIAFSIAYLVGAFYLLMQTDPRLAVPLSIWLILYALLMRWTVRNVGLAAKAASDARSEVTGRVVDSYSNIHSVKLFAHHDREIDYAKEAIENVRTTFQREMRVFTTMEIMLVILNGLLVVSVVGWAIYLWQANLASVGVIAAASALTLRLNAMTGWIMWALTNFFQNLGIVSEGLETIAQPVKLLDAPDAKPLALQGGAIEMNNVTHHYGRDKGGLDNLSLLISSGEKVGIVGRSGAGKSTLVKLLLRLYDTENGEILIDGQPVGSVTQNSLRQAIGTVQQESSLLHRSIRDNILYGRPDASDEEIISAAQKAAAFDFIVDLEDNKGRKGLDAQVGERGVKLSGGQRQRIILARAILKDAPILILDEATSALDSEIEQHIQATLYDMMEGKTVIAIAHRLSTIAKMDRILVLNDGQIAEQGTHSELIAVDGMYRSFWDRQSGGFLNLEATENES